MLFGHQKIEIMIYFACFIAGMLFDPILSRIYKLNQLRKLKNLLDGESRETAKRNAGEWRND
jgi:hypothetical protein